MFITLEGPEGSGKSSQVFPLAEFLRESGYDVLTTREPGGTPIGDQVRQVLLDKENNEMKLRTEILLFQASRAQLVEEVIRPHLEKGGLVLCDRYADSTLAYQGYGYGRDMDELRTIVRFATGGLTPDLTLLLDMDVEVGLKRRQKGGDVNRLDIFELTFHQRVREGYQLLARQEPHRWVVIDADRSSVQVQKEIRQVVLKRLRDKT